MLSLSSLSLVDPTTAPVPGYKDGPCYYDMFGTQVDLDRDVPLYGLWRFLVFLLLPPTMDVDWCLTCEKRLDASSLYCSKDCRYLAASTSTLLDQDEVDEIIFHPVHIISLPLDTSSRWTGNDPAGISAWAAEIPYGLPPEHASSSYSSRPPQLLPRNSRIVPPSLCKNTLQVILPLSAPLQTPKHPHPTAQPSDTSRISLKSALTESSLATPASSHPMPTCTIQHPLDLGSIYSNVRSWVTPLSSPVPFKRPAQVKSLKLMPSAHNTRPHPVKVVSPPDRSHGFLDDDVHWKASPIFLKRPQTKRGIEHQQLWGRRLPHELPRLADQDSSFRARGRKASRAVA